MILGCKKALKIFELVTTPDPPQLLQWPSQPPHYATNQGVISSPDRGLRQKLKLISGEIAC